MVPVSIKVFDNKKKIQITYDKGTYLLLPSSFLRMYSPSAENKKSLLSLNTNKFKSVKILKISKVGNYAIRISFDDGHITGIYSWEYLHEIGSKFENRLNT